MKDKFWKIIAIIAILLWTVTLCVWYVIKTTPPRYMKSDYILIDLKESKYFDIQHKMWIDVKKQRSLQEIMKTSSEN